MSRKKKRQRSGGRPAGREERLVKAFTRWHRAARLEGRELLSAAEDTSEVAGVLETLLRAERRIRKHHDVELTTFDLLVELMDYTEDADGSTPLPVLETLIDYLSFLNETGQWEEGENELRDCLGYLLDLHDDALDDVLRDGIGALLDAAGAPEVSSRRTALEEVPYVRAVEPLLAWIGHGRQITGTGALRRAGIRPVAALLGIDVVGVATEPSWGGSAPLGGEEFWGEVAAGEQVPVEDSPGAAAERDKYRVQSMWDLPQLGAWWAGLVHTGMLELTSTRAYPGPRLDEWHAADDETAVAIREELVAGIIEQLVSASAVRVEGLLPALAAPIVAVITAELTVALLPDPKKAGPMQQLSAAQGPLDAIVYAQALVALSHLEEMGIVHRRQGTAEELAWTVPDGLRAAVVVALTVLHERHASGEPR